MNDTVSILSWKTVEEPIPSLDAIFAEIMDYALSKGVGITNTGGSTINSNQGSRWVLFQGSRTPELLVHRTSSNNWYIAVRSNNDVDNPIAQFRCKDDVFKSIISKSKEFIDKYLSSPQRQAPVLSWKTVDATPEYPWKFNTGHARELYEEAIKRGDTATQDAAAIELLKDFDQVGMDIDKYKNGVGIDSKILQHAQKVKRREEKRYRRSLSWKTVDEGFSDNLLPGPWRVEGWIVTDKVENIDDFITRAKPNQIWFSEVEYRKERSSVLFVSPAFTGDYRTQGWGDRNSGTFMYVVKGVDWFWQPGNQSFLVGGEGNGVPNDVFPLYLLEKQSSEKLSWKTVVLDPPKFVRLFSTIIYGQVLQDVTTIVLRCLKFAEISDKVAIKNISQVDDVGDGYYLFEVELVGTKEDLRRMETHGGGNVTEAAWNEDEPYVEPKLSWKHVEEDVVAYTVSDLARLVKPGQTWKTDTPRVNSAQYIHTSLNVIPVVDTSENESFSGVALLRGGVWDDLDFPEEDRWYSIAGASIKADAFPFTLISTQPPIKLSWKHVEEEPPQVVNTMEELQRAVGVGQVWTDNTGYLPYLVITDTSLIVRLESLEEEANKYWKIIQGAEWLNGRKNPQPGANIINDHNFPLTLLSNDKDSWLRKPKTSSIIRYATLTNVLKSALEREIHYKLTNNRKEFPEVEQYVSDDMIVQDAFRVVLQEQNITDHVTISQLKEYSEEELGYTINHEPYMDWLYWIQRALGDCRYFTQNQKRISPDLGASRAELTRDWWKDWSEQHVPANIKAAPWYQAMFVTTIRKMLQEKNFGDILAEGYILPQSLEEKTEQIVNPVDNDEGEKEFVDSEGDPIETKEEQEQEQGVVFNPPSQHELNDTKQQLVDDLLDKLTDAQMRGDQAQITKIRKQLQELSVLSALSWKTVETEQIRKYYADTCSNPNEAEAILRERIQDFFKRLRISKEVTIVNMYFLKKDREDFCYFTVTLSGSARAFQKIDQDDSFFLNPIGKTAKHTLSWKTVETEQIRKYHADICWDVSEAETVLRKRIQSFFNQLQIANEVTIVSMRLLKQDQEDFCYFTVTLSGSPKAFQKIDQDDSFFLNPIGKTKSSKLSWKTVDEVDPKNIKKGDKFNIFHYIANKVMSVTALGNAYDQDGDTYVFAKFPNGDKAIMVWIPEESIWELAEGSVTSSKKLSWKTVVPETSKTPISDMIAPYMSDQLLSYFENLPVSIAVTLLNKGIIKNDTPVANSDVTSRQLIQYAKRYQGTLSGSPYDKKGWGIQIENIKKKDVVSIGLDGMILVCDRNTANRIANELGPDLFESAGRGKYTFWWD